MKATLSFGLEAVNHYDETGKIPTRKWLDNHDGNVKTVEFDNQGEYDAYSLALSDAKGWEETRLLEPNPAA